MSDRNLKQRTELNYSVKIRKGASGTLVLLKIFYDECVMRKSSAFEFHKRLKEGREDVHHEASSRQSKMQRNDTNRMEREHWCSHVEDYRCAIIEEPKV